MGKKETSDSFFNDKFGKKGKESQPEQGEEKKSFRKDKEERKEQRPFARKEGKPFSKDGDRGPRPRREGADEDRRPRDGEKRPYPKKDGRTDDRSPRPGSRSRDEGAGGERKPFRRDNDRAEGSRGPREERSRDDRNADGPRKPYARDNNREERPRGPREERGDRPDRNADGARKPYPKRDSGDAKPYAKREDKPFAKRPFDKDDARPVKDRQREEESDQDWIPKKKKKEKEEDLSAFKAPKGIAGKPFPKKIGHDKKRPGAEAEAAADDDAVKPERKRRFNGDNQVDNGEKKPGHYDDEDDFEDDELEETVLSAKQPEQMPLNKYIAHCGLCSRRDAVEYVKQGKVRVNGELVTEPGYKIKPEDTVIVAGKKILPQKNLTYILLNKPKGFLTTTEDDRDRDTVMHLVAGSGVERLFPVGRLDRQTTGLLLMTNDGELAQKLSHPKYMIKKVYQVTLDKSLTKPDFQKILQGITLEDGLINVDALAYLDERHELGVEIHSGRNRIVRRIFESLGYQVEKLDRVMYAGLTKKNLPRGKWRLLTEREIILLKHFKS